MNRVSWIRRFWRHWVWRIGIAAWGGVQAGMAGELARALSAPVEPPVITVQPQSQTIKPGESASFSVTATGTPPLIYQWRRLLTGVPVDLPGATNSLLSLDPTQTTNGGIYNVMVGNTAGSVTSSNAQLIVQMPPFIVRHPQDFTAQIGGFAFFSAMWTGTAPFQFQWLRDGKELAGATNFTLVVSQVQSTNAGSYSVRISNAAGSVTSLPAQLIVVDSLKITSQPQNQTVPPGATATFSVTVSGGIESIGYQWMFDGRDLPGATNRILEIPNVQENQIGFYSVRVSSRGSGLISDTALLSLGVNADAPIVIQSPLSQTVLAGGTATFRGTASGAPPLEYQWRLDGNELAGATNDVLVVTNVQAVNVGTYTVRVRNEFGQTQSSGAVLNLLGPPTIISQPSSQTLKPGSDAFFRIDVAGLGPFQYQWQRNGIDLPGQTSSLLGLTNIQPADAGFYGVRVTGPGGTVTSFEARLSVEIPGASPTVTLLPFFPLVTLGTSVTLTASASGEPPLVFRWFRNGVELPGETNSTLVLTNLQVSDVAVYTVEVSNRVGAATSQPLSLILAGRPLSIGQFGRVIQLEGQPGTIVQIEASSDLVHWTTLDRLTFAGTRIEYTDASAPANGSRFYRSLTIR